MRTNGWRSVVVCFGLILIATTAQAADQVYADVWAKVDWSTWGYNLDGVTSIAMTPSESYSRAYANNSKGESGPETQKLPDWVDTNADANTLDSHSSASTTSSLISTDAYAARKAGSGQRTDAESDAWRDGQFVVTGSGWIHFTIDYHLKVGLLVDGLDQEATGYAGAHLSLENVFTSEFSYDDSILDETISSSSYAASVNDDFTVSLYFNDGDTGRFCAGGTSEAHVVIPEPATLLLLGLGGLTLLRQRKSQR